MKSGVFVAQCSTTCGKGVHERDVVCRSVHGAELDETGCDAATKPRSQTTCRASSCPPDVQLSVLASDNVVSGLKLTIPGTSWRTGSWTEVCIRIYKELIRTRCEIL